MTNAASDITAIVPAYNEAPTIGAIVKTLVDSDLFRDVIVVSDGSTDETADQARQAGASMVYEWRLNQGKGKALMHGVTHTDADLLFFLDADLLGLRVDHLKTLIDPVVKGLAGMSVGLRDRGRMLMFCSRFLPLIGGERVLHRTIFEAIPDDWLQGFRVEMALNARCSQQGWPIATCPLWGLHIRRKMQKVGVWTGFKQYLRMSGQVFQAWIMSRVTHKI